MIEVEDLWKSYGPFVALRGVSFQVSTGTIAGFLGPNGAGKSTTMKILTGFLAPSAGSASIGGMDIRERRIEASRRFGYLPENGPLYPDMTPHELLEFFGKARGLQNRRLKERIDAVTAH